MVWILSSLSTYAFAAMSCYTTTSKVHHADDNKLHRWLRWEPVEDVLSSLLRFMQAFLQLPHLRRNQPPSIQVMAWQACASCLALVHVISGTLILSSLIFVGFHNILVILARFLASTLVTRMIVLLQLDTVRTQIDDASAVDPPGRSHVDPRHSADTLSEHFDNSIGCGASSRHIQLV